MPALVSVLKLPDRTLQPEPPRGAITGLYANTKEKKLLRLCNSSKEDAAGHWERSNMAWWRARTYDQLPILNQCQLPNIWFPKWEEWFVKRTGCASIGLDDAFARLGDIPVLMITASCIMLPPIRKNERLNPRRCVCF